MMTLRGEDKNENGNLTMEMLRLVNDCMETFNAIKTALNLPSVCRLTYCIQHLVENPRCDI